jgi:hypothetical protein
MNRIYLFYLFALISLISLSFLIYGFRTKKHRTKVLNSYLLGASVLILGLLIQNPIAAWIIALIGLIFIIAPNNMHEIDFKKNG